MAKIVINAITHRNNCIYSLGEADAQEYDRTVGRYFERAALQAQDSGFEFEVDAHGQGSASYRVTDERDWEDSEAAHGFMQYELSDFWSDY